MTASKFATGFFAFSIELDYAEKLFSTQILDAFYADYVYNYLFQNNIKEAQEILSRFEKICTEKKYINYLENQRELLVNGKVIIPSVFIFKDNTLNENELNSLLDHCKGNKTVLVFWSTNYLDDELCCFNKLSYIFKNFKIIFVCIDNPEDKNLWVFNLINYNLKGNHFFNPIPNNCKLISKLLDNAGLCEDKYMTPIEDSFIIDENGKVLNRFSSFSNLLENTGY